jgi:hypothetical protein
MLRRMRSSSGYGRKYVALPSEVCSRQTNPGRASVSERVDPAQPIHEPSHNRIVHRCPHPAATKARNRRRYGNKTSLDSVRQVVLHFREEAMRAALALISFLLAAVLLIASYEQHKLSLADDSDLVQASRARIANRGGGEILHVFKVSHEKEDRAQIELAVGSAFLIAGLALIASITMTKKCPLCGKHINAAVSVCRFCGEDLGATGNCDNE